MSQDYWTDLVGGYPRHVPRRATRVIRNDADNAARGRMERCRRVQEKDVEDYRRHMVRFALHEPDCFTRVIVLIGAEIMQVFPITKREGLRLHNSNKYAIVFKRKARTFRACRQWIR